MRKSSTGGEFVLSITDNIFYDPAEAARQLQNETKAKNRRAKRQAALDAKPILKPESEYLETAQDIDYQACFQDTKIPLPVAFKILFGIAPDNEDFHYRNHPKLNRLIKAQLDGALPSPLRLLPLIEWAREENYIIHPATEEAYLEHLAQRRQRAIDQQNTTATGRRIDERYVKSLELVLGSVVLEALKYDAQENQPKVWSDIAQMMLLQGVKRDPRTIKSIIEKCIERVEEEQQ